MNNFDMQPIDPQVAYLAQLQAEALAMPDAARADHEALIAELAGEVALAEHMQLEAEEYIRRAKQLVDGEALPTAPTADVDMGRIGWISDDGEAQLPAQEITAGGLDYVFVDLTDKNRITERMREENKRAGKDEKLMDKVTQESIPILWSAIMTGKGLERSISVGNKSQKGLQSERSLNTTFPAYKVSVLGKDNRAILLILDKTEEGKPVIGLAAIYDHKFQQDVYNNLFIKTVRQKSHGKHH